ncbi:hypothetical protein DMI67_12280 [Akkermansia muciniphila]|uniref:hypothetical protein n=1 Tax=Akkermansia muciniphila TaxID=239935 RepID=UPI00138E6530|nr:hypothetical protein [Akkermansia muciniphila]QHV52182.1 hypothetical protein DMI67_12280 [Akkermansia muciniphila]
MNTNANWVAFGAGNTLGGGTVFIDGKGFHFSAGATAANFEIGATHGAMQNGSSGATYTFSGSLSGSGTWAMAANVRMNNVLTGSLKDFSGTLVTNETSSTTIARPGTSVPAGLAPQERGMPFLETAPFWEATRAPRIPGWPHNTTSITTIRNWC